MKDVVLHLTKEDRKDICYLLIACSRMATDCYCPDKWLKLHNKLSCTFHLLDTLKSDN